jgi:glycerol-3-phosphate dehydrogenase
VNAQIENLSSKQNIFQRESFIERITTTPEWDIIVIGGGSSGLGIALDAVMRGYKTLLVEQSDFAKGTSSRSTKLIHGGVRYLAQGNISLVREASIERGRLLRNAPHLVKDLVFVVPVYSLFDRFKYSVGLKIYDQLAGKYKMAPSMFVSKKEAIKKLPGIKMEGLQGAVIYHDAQFDDARLAINLFQTICEHGGVVINYMQVAGLLKNSDNKINAVSTTDVESGKTYTIKAKAIVNATGVFVDDILQMDSPRHTKTISVSQGAHIVLDKSFFPSSSALMIPKTSDGRVLFAIPWHDKLIVGTTDTLVDDVELEPRALEQEIDFILETAGEYFVKKPSRRDVLSVFAGLRPLAASGKSGQKTKEISRGHKMIVSTSGLFTILGGKWTTYRKMGEDMLDFIEKKMNWPEKKSATFSLSVHGSDNVNFEDRFYFYGSDANHLNSQIQKDVNGWLSKKLNIHQAQVVWAIEYEMARTVEDVLARRTRALFLDANEAIRIAPQVASLMSGILKKDDKWKSEQLEFFNRLALNYVLK